MAAIMIPRLGWNMEEGIFLGWLKKEGEQVRAGEAIFRLESDKAAQDIECLDSGTLRIAPGGPKEGDKVPVGMVLGQIEEAQTADRELQLDKTVVAIPPLTISPQSSSANLQSAIGNLQSPASSPRARRAAVELGIDWTKLEGSGRWGRIRERDVRRAAPTVPRAATREKGVSPGDTSSPLPCTQGRGVGGEGMGEVRIRLSSLRRTAAERLVTSRQCTVPVTLTTTANVTNLIALRRQFKATATAADIVPSLSDFFIKLTAVALQGHPLLAARWAEDHLVLPSALNIGLAVHTEAGLVVPVLGQVPSLTLKQLAVMSRDLIERARQGKLTTKDMQGGVFTVTNLGMFGIDTFTPIINHPECGILGIGRIRQVPIFVDNKIVAQDQVALSLTFDHRIVDGVPAARFLQTLSQAVENPGPWLMP